MVHAMKRKPPKPTGKRVIFRAWRRDPRTGDVLWARDYGLKAWPIPVDE
jgi:hypothetical protein